MNGFLAESVLPRLLREIYVGRRTGLLDLEQGDERRSVCFRHGHLGHARTSSVPGRLGSVLVRMGALKPDDLERATRIVSEDGRRLGAVLQDLNLVEAARIEEGLAEQARAVLGEVVTWNEGRYAFTEQPAGAGPDADVVLRLSTGDLILEAVRRLRDPDVVRYALGDLDRVPVPSSDPLLRFQKITLTPTDGYMLSRIDGGLSAREVLAVVPFDREEALRSLFGLLCTGVIEFASGPVERPPLVFSIETGLAGSGSCAPPGKATAPPGEAPAADAEADEPKPVDPRQREIEHRRAELIELHANLSKRHHFDLLGVPRTATDMEIKQAYFRLARMFHPDVHHDPAFADLRDKLEAVFIRLGEAYDLLRDQTKRAAYESRLPRPRPTAEAGPTEAIEPEPPPPEDPERERRLALERLRVAEQHLAEAHYWDAIQNFEGALPALEGPHRLRAQVGLARALAKNPHWQKRAEETLLGVVREAPRYVDAHLELASLYRARDLRSRALAQYRKVVEIQPDHDEARAAIAELGGAEATEPGSEAGGRIRKLFGRRP